MEFANIKIGNISTSPKEIFDLVKSWLAISFAFAVLESKSLFSDEFYANLMIVSLTAGAGFLLHELGHKLVAQRYGCFAEFRSFDLGLLLAVVMSFAGFIFAAPGAVLIAGRVNKRKNGIISAAGPVVNLVLAIFFYSLGFYGMEKIATYGFMINSWLALFNMIPFGPLDGAKIFKYNKAVYFTIVAVAIIFVFLL